MDDSALSLYLHIPFCTVKCSYCDFNSYAGLERLKRPYVDALIAEMGLWRREAAGHTVQTVFFGGGTPSLLPLGELERIIAAIRAAFDVAPGCEVSLEANPGTIDLDYFRGLLSLGVNRLSMGVQSFDDAELVALERLHSAEEARQAYRWARQAGFQRINLDLMYGLPEQPLARWQANLEEALRLAPDHLSLYALTIEPETALAHYIAEGRAPAPDSDLQADMYEWTEERLVGSGYEHYEISNWAQPGQRCCHNQTYWENRPYLGFGAGAHSYFGGERFANVKSPQRYVKRVREGSPIDFRERRDETETLADTLILGLRLSDGIDIAELEQRFGRGALAPYEATLGEFESLGLLERDERAIRLTARGRLLANELFVRLLPD